MAASIEISVEHEGRLKFVDLEVGPAFTLADVTTQIHAQFKDFDPTSHGLQYTPPGGTEYSTIETDKDLARALNKFADAGTPVKLTTKKKSGPPPPAASSAFPCLLCCVLSSITLPRPSPPRTISALAPLL